MNNKLGVVVKQPIAKDYYEQCLINRHMIEYNTISVDQILMQLLYLQGILYY